MSSMDAEPGREVPMKSRHGFTLVELLILGVALATLIAVALPAIIQHVRRGRTTAALDSLEAIHRSAVAYYFSQRVDAQGVARCQLPDSQGMTPDVTSWRCCGGENDLDDDGRCDLVNSQWDTPQWQALDFSMRDQSYFGYTFVSVRNGATARFTARANGDLNCDSVLSTFERYGYGVAAPNGSGCALRGSEALFHHLDIE